MGSKEMELTIQIILEKFRQKGENSGYTQCEAMRLSNTLFIQTEEI